MKKGGSRVGLYLASVVVMCFAIVLFAFLPLTIESLALVSMMGLSPLLYAVLSIKKGRNRFS